MPDVGSVKYLVDVDDSKVDEQSTKVEKTLVSKFGGAFGKAAAGLAAGTAVVAAGVAVAGKQIVGMAGDVSKTGDEIDKMSQKIGISAKAYQEWGYVFERSGADVNNLQAGMKTLSSVITDAGNGSKSAAEKLSAIGVSIEEIGSLSQEDQLALVITRLQEMGEGSERTAAATDLLGRSATDMAAVLNMSAEETQALIAETEEYGMIMSDDAVAASAAYQDSLTKLQHTFGGLKNGLVSELLPGLTQVVDGIADVANGTTSLDDAIDNGLKSVLNAIDTKLPELLNRGVQIIQKVAEGIQRNLPQILSAAGTIVSKIAEGIMAVLPTLLQTALQLVTSLASYIVQNAPQLLQTAGQLIATLMQGLASAIPQLLSSAVQLITSLASYLIQNGPQILQAGVQLIGQLVSGLIQSLPQVANAALQLITEAKNKFTSVDWGSVGKAIVDGLVNGLMGAGHLLWDAAKGLAKNALDGAKKALHIGSPSKVFRDEVGKMIPAGMALGIDDGTGEVEDSMDSLTDRMLRGFTADVDYNLPNLSSYAEDLGATISATGATQINVPLYMDGREVARATARFTNEQLAWEAR